MSEVIKIRGKIGSVRVGTAHARHALPNLNAGHAPEQESERFPEPEPLHIAPLPSVDIDALLAAEFERGRKTGMQDAEADLLVRHEQEMSVEREHADAFFGSFQKEMGRLQERLQTDAFRFAVAVAGRIVKKEIALDDDVVVRQVHEAIRRVAGVESVRIRINPADEASLRQHKETLIAGSESVREIVLEADEKVGRGGCILETSSGTVDARIATQLEQIEAALFGQTIS